MKRVGRASDRRDAQRIIDRMLEQRGYSDESTSRHNLAIALSNIREVITDDKESAHGTR